MPSPTIDEELLARFVPMSALDASYLRELSNHATIVELQAGDSLDEELRLVEAIHYLVDGTLCMTGGGVPDITIRSGDASARFALPGTESVGRHARAETPVSLMRLERAKISTLMIWAQASSTPNTQHGAQALRDDITALLLQSRLFARIPPSNIERVGQLIEPLQVKAGETVVRQGDDGDFYYVIEQGRCEVLREANDGSPALRLAQLSAGESFGEEALLTDSKRNATIRMLDDGVLLRLTRDWFVELISAPLLHEVSHERAEDLIATGARWVDVRLHEEYERDGLADAINVPLAEIRGRLAEFPKDGSYITVCNTGRRAQAAAFLLSQRGLHSCSLRDGIATRRPQVRGIRAIEESLPQLQAELLRANDALEQALNSKAHADAAREVEAKALHSSTSDSDVAGHLQALETRTAQAGDVLRAAVQRKQELESSIRDIQAREASAQRATQLEVERLRDAAKSRLESEKLRLSKHYREASTQLEQIERARREAEERFEEEKQRIEQELEQSRREMDEQAERVRAAIDKAKHDAEHKARSIRVEHEKLESDLRERTELGLREEREHLEEEFSRSIAAQEKARQVMELAQAEREAAERETQRLRAATESELQQRHEQEQQQREDEVHRLRAQSQAAAARLEQAQRARNEAQARHERFSSSLRQSDKAQDPAREQALRDELAQASVHLASADDELDKAQIDLSQATQAEQLAEQTQAVAVDRADELRLQIFEEMQEWIEEEHSRSAEELEQAAHYARELERIQAEKDRKRLEKLSADENMLADIESMLSGKGGDDPFNIAMRTHTIAEEKARLVQRARVQATDQAARARAALADTPRKS